MSQLTRGQLKSIVKECLVEILSEGLAGGDRNSLESNAIQERKSPTPRAPAPPTRSSSPALNSVVFGTGQAAPKKTENSNMGLGRRQTPDGNRETVLKNHISTITTDPVMSQIFADTASSTLQEQIQADRGQGRPNLSLESAPDPISDNFLSESAKNWSILAFSDAPKAR